MSEPAPSPFAERKTSRWVWIVPSVLLHVVILVVWLTLPEPPPRKPGERKLTINPEQAEELQEHVEEANLATLQANVSELKAIKERMEQIREGKMARLETFEQDMAVEAPLDMAGLVREVISLQKEITEKYQDMKSQSQEVMAKTPAVRDLLEKDEAEGIRAMATLRSLREPFGPMQDEFEEVYTQLGAQLQTMEARMEWVGDPALKTAFTEYQAILETAEKAHHQAFGPVSNAYRGSRARSFQMVTENPKETIQFLQSFDQEVRIGEATAKQQRAELENSIQEAEQNLTEVEKSLNTERETLNAINKREARDAWSAQRSVVRELENTTRSLQQQLKNDRRQLSRTDYRPDQRTAREVKRTRGRIKHAMEGDPNLERIADAMALQKEVLEASESFIAQLEAAR